MENLVGFVKGSFFKVRRFQDRADLEPQLEAWHREVNEPRPCRATGVIPAVRRAEEALRLRPLKVRPEELALRIPVYVGPTGTVMHDGHAYSMPPEAISMPGTLYLYADRVRIVAGRHQALHPRKFAAHESSTLAAHRSALVAAVSGQRGKRYLKRQQLLELGEPALRYLTEIVHRRPRHWIPLAGGSGSPTRPAAKPWPRGFVAGPGSRAPRGSFQCRLRGGLAATRLGFSGGDQVKMGIPFAAERARGGAKTSRRRRGGNVGIRRFLPNFQARWEGWKSPALPSRPESSAAGLSTLSTVRHFHRDLFPLRAHAVWAAGKRSQAASVYQDFFR